jgi:hypothetical protein
MSRLAKYTWMLCVFFLCTSSSITLHAQLVSASLSKEKMLLGEQAELILKVEHVGRNNLNIKQWFNLPDTFNHLEVVQRLPIDTLQTEKGFSYKQSILLTGFDSGYWVLPVLQVQLSNNQLAATNPLGITILPVDVHNMTDYHDVKDILPVSLHTSWKIIVALALTVVLSFFGLLWALSYRKTQKLAKPTEQYFGTIYKQAIQQLDALQKQNLVENNQHKLFYSNLILICQQFSDTTMQTSTLNKTPDEYMLSLKGLVGNEQAQSAYFQLLRLASAVKYARYIPPIAESNQAIIIARQFIDTLNLYYQSAHA